MLSCVSCHLWVIKDKERVRLVVWISVLKVHLLRCSSILGCVLAGSRVGTDIWLLVWLLEIVWDLINLNRLLRFLLSLEPSELLLLRWLLRRSLWVWCLQIVLVSSSFQWTRALSGIRSIVFLKNNFSLVFLLFNDDVHASILVPLSMRGNHKSHCTAWYVRGHTCWHQLVLLD